MVLGPEHRRAFLVCEGNELLTVLDLEKHKPVVFLPLAKGPDAVKFDSRLQRVYVACYSGAISAFQEDDPDPFRNLEDLRYRRRCTSLAVDEQTQRVHAPNKRWTNVPRRG
jgi:hypothetical protein